MDLLYTAAIRINSFDSYANQTRTRARSNTDPENYALKRGSAVNYQIPISPNSTALMGEQIYDDTIPSPSSSSSSPDYSTNSTYLLPTSSSSGRKKSDSYFPYFDVEQFNRIDPSLPLSSLALLSISALELSTQSIQQQSLSSPNLSEKSSTSTSSTRRNSTTESEPKGRGAHPFTASITRILVETWNSGDFYPNDEVVKGIMNRTRLEREQIKGWFGNRRHRCKGNEIKEVSRAQRAANISIPRTQTRGRN